MLPSWRETASQEAQDDLDGLVNATLPFVQQMLERHGEFFPFAAAVTADSTVEMLGADPGADDRPASTDVLDQLVGGLRDRADRKSTRLNSSHVETSYAVFCLK